MIPDFLVQALPVRARQWKQTDTGNLVRMKKTGTFFMGDTSYMVQKIALLSVAGAIGTLARYGLSGLVQRIGGSAFPWGTMAVNMTGCLLAGLLWELFESRWAVSAEVRIIVLVGFLGAFTTFSAMILETGMLMRQAEWLSAAANLTVQNGLGIAFLLAGMALGRMI
jgi:CrcB protein